MQIDGTIPIKNDTESKSELSDLLACKNKCAVTDFEGNHCPETPTTAVVVNDKKLMLCPRCAINIAKGMYGIMNIS